MCSRAASEWERERERWMRLGEKSSMRLWSWEVGYAVLPRRWLYTGSSSPSPPTSLVIFFIGYKVVFIVLSFVFFKIVLKIKIIKEKNTFQKGDEKCGVGKIRKIEGIWCSYWDTGEWVACASSTWRCLSSQTNCSSSSRVFLSPPGIGSIR